MNDWTESLWYLEWERLSKRDYHGRKLPALNYFEVDKELRLTKEKNRLYPSDDLQKAQNLQGDLPA